MNTWFEVEKSIYKTKIFLFNNLSPSPFRQEDPIKCNDCILRYISVLIVSGKIKVNKINHKDNFWSPSIIDPNSEIKHHGSDWHNRKIEEINGYFLLKNYTTKKEPNLHYGRADLGISGLNIFIEVGTVNFYKLLINCIQMKNCVIIVAPNDNYILEFYL